MDYKQFEVMSNEKDKLDTILDEISMLQNGAQFIVAINERLLEIESLKLELQKQKELNSELVAVLDHFYSHGYIHGVNYSDKNKIESLTKKSSAI